jgi:protein-L-isoaspartate(D-aspartate) O-methyltransferase
MATADSSRALATAALVLLAAVPAKAADDDYAAARSRLADIVAEDVRRTAGYLGTDTLSPRVVTALETVPRHELVPEGERPHAYENRPLPIGFGQTISQPYIVAIMTDLVDAGPASNVLEIGTGSGYQAAMLAEVGASVCSMEIIPELAVRARRDLDRLGYDAVRTRTGDGYHGWPECGPYDAIVVTAGATHVPPPLIEQLVDGGRMIIPVGSRFLTQQLLLVEKKSATEITTRHVLPVRFVPLTGGHEAPPAKSQ